jgi:multidrug efflux system membrane fusion protein
MNRSYLIAGALALAAAGWIVSGELTDATSVPARKPPAELSTLDKVAKVRVRQIGGEEHIERLVLRGHSRAERIVDIKAEIDGPVETMPPAKGTRVDKGELLAQIAEEDRPARLQEARALLKQREVEYGAARKLANKGYRAQTELAASEAALEAADAAVRRAEVDLDNLTVEAPYAGIIGTRHVEEGAFVKRGDDLLRLVDLDPILVVADVTERNIGHLKLGMPAHVRLVTGTKLEGMVRYIAPVADPQTRTFEIEIEIANPDYAIPDGITAEAILLIETRMAHLIPPAILTLSDEGQVGVRSVDQNNRVTFIPVEILGEDGGGVWVAGLPKTVTLITVGQEFVEEGQQVEPVADKGVVGQAAPSSDAPTLLKDLGS